MSPPASAEGRAPAPHLSGDAVVMSLQNGVENASAIAACVRALVVPTVVYVATEMPRKRMFGAWNSSVCASLSMRPQEGCGGCVPRPR